MSKLKCPSCASNSNELKVKTVKFISPRTNKLCSIKGVPYYLCSSCGEDWQSSAQFKSYRELVADVDYEWLTPKQIETFRLASPIPSKKELASFLCLNPKAFVHWEKKGAGPSRAYDLLIRLIMRSTENWDFVQKLHGKNFRVDKEDYGILQKNPLPRPFRKLVSSGIQTYLNPSEAAPKGAVLIGRGYNYSRALQ